MSNLIQLAKFATNKETIAWPGSIMKGLVAVRILGIKATVYPTIEDWPYRYKSDVKEVYPCA